MQKTCCYIIVLYIVVVGLHEAIEQSLRYNCRKKKEEEEKANLDLSSACI